ncbi:unnamed protein product [Aphanomyces euteiches]|uniref:RING-type domain-containing protein n=1 Tax=Aphanomyces euteiches TaxID=100861 RepID=A0A6G0XJV9_9STRA|nr:hypothetical protein Ae201684_003946 [Aphanomyces euteiches]KAH9084968.1 hypothetical protein Ae201684P_002200 [Aphanomyces euteiches]KAH9157319.1 hypothetical protein AeRB84_000849 [Aphanomyces euteiches]
MKWVQEQLSQCLPGQNGNSRWNKRAATYWSEDTATAKALAEEMGHDTQEDDFVKCTKKNLATKLAPKATMPCLRPPTKPDPLDVLDIPLALLSVDDAIDAKTSNIAPGLISVASCDTDQEESLAMKLVHFDVTSGTVMPKATNMRFLSLLRNIRRLESQYVETGKTGRMQASTIVELPSFIYTSPNAVRPASPDSKRCAICLSDFTESQELRVLPCFHKYHSWCIDKWLLGNCKCPVCILSP